MSTIELKNLTKKFGDLTAVNNVSLKVDEDEVLCLLGPSGCGKTTTLRMVAGLEIATSGNIYKAGAQFLIDQQIKNKTGKNSFAYVKEEVVKQNKKENFDADLIELIETRVKIVHTKIAKQNEEYNSNKDFIQLVERRIKIVRKKLDIIKINQ